MATALNINQLTNALTPSHVHFRQLLCIKSRNHKVKCTQCVDVCCANALSFLGANLVIDKAACVNCGACTTVCPTQAVASLTPTDEELTRRAAEAAINAQGIACFTCARKASRHLADESKVTVVDCLSRVDEALLLSLASHQVSEIYLVNGTCETCKYHSCGSIAAETVQQVTALLQAFDTSAEIIWTSDFPETVLMSPDKTYVGEERRLMFSQTTSAASSAAKMLAADTIKEKTGIDIQKKTQLTSVKHPNTERHDQILDALDRLGEPQQSEPIQTRRFGSIEIEDTCTACMQCTIVCPTKALTRSALHTERGEQKLEFIASKCIGCAACQDVCPEQSLLFMNEVCLDDVFDFEPRVITITTLFPFA